MNDDRKKSKDQLIKELEYLRSLIDKKEKVDQLIRDEENLRITLESIGDAVVSTDIDGKVLRMNPVAEQLTGWMLKEAKGKQLEEIFQIVNAKTRKKVINPTQKVIKHGKIVGLANHTVLIARDGTEYQITDSASPIYNSSNKMVGTVMVFRDITKEYFLYEKIAENELKYRTLYESMSEGICQHEVIYNNDRKAIDYRIIEVNPAYEHITGLSANQVEGKLATKAYQTNKAPFLEQYAKVAETGEPLAFETYFEPMGKHFYVSVVSREKGKFTTVFVDISAMKQMAYQLQKQHQELIAIFEGIEEPVYVVEPDTYFLLYANQKAIKEFNGDLNKKCYEVVHRKKEPCKFCSNAMVLGENLGKTYTWEYLSQTNQRWYQGMARALDWPDGRKVCLKMAIDITDRKNMEMKLAKDKDQLDAMVKLRTAKLESANRELESFAYTVSHDLRAPLRAINGFARILLEEYGSTLPNEGKRLGKIIQQNAAKMDLLIHELLEFSKLRTTSLKIGPVGMKEMIQSVMTEHFEINEISNIKLEIGNLPQVLVDQNMFKQVWINLISNALKFSSYRDLVHISIESKKNDSQYIFYIKDNGAGFNMQYSHKLFQVFQRLHSEADFPGTGVGLAIVKRIVERHGGRVWAESQEDRGSTFYFSLPLSL